MVEKAIKTDKVKLMKGINMYYAIKTLMDAGRSIRRIANELKIDRKTVRKIKQKIDANKGEIKIEEVSRKSQCDVYQAEIKKWLEDGLSIRLIHDRIRDEYGSGISYSGVRHYIGKQVGTGEV